MTDHPSDSPAVDPAADAASTAAPLDEPSAQDAKVTDGEPDLPAEAVPSPSDEVEVVLRRAPRVGRFMAAGLLLGGIASFILAIATAGWSALTTTNTFWVTLLWTGPLGLALGALLSLLIDRRSSRSADRQKDAHAA